MLFVLIWCSEPPPWVSWQGDSSGPQASVGFRGLPWALAPGLRGGCEACSAPPLGDLAG